MAICCTPTGGKRVIFFSRRCGRSRRWPVSLGGLGILLQPGRTELSVGASTIDVGSASHFRMVQVYDKLGLRMPGRGGGNCPVQGRLVEAAIQATDTIVENVVFVSRLWCIIPVLGACLSRQSFLDTGSLHHHSWCRLVLPSLSCVFHDGRIGVS